MLGERDAPAAIVGVIVAVAFVDVEVGAAQPDGDHLQPTTSRGPQPPRRHVADRHHARRGEDGGALRVASML